jgi:mercuric reductase
MKTCEIQIDGMTCDQCAVTIEKNLNIEGVEDKHVSYADGKATVSYDENITNEKSLTSVINSIGHYKVTDTKDVTAEEYAQDEKHLIIIGGGSAAFAATIQAKEYAAKVTMINDGLPIGGTCVNVGCVPSKNLIRAGETLYKANNNPFEGISSSGKVEDFKTIIQNKRDLVLDLREQKYISIIQEMEDFELLEGRAALYSATSVKVGERIVEGSHILIATGARPMIAEIEGLSEVAYLTNEEAFELESLPESMIILGGSYIALEMAQMFSRLGSKVTILQRSERILTTQQADLTDALTGYFKDEGIEIITGNSIQSVTQKDDNVIVSTIVDGKTEHFSAEKLVVATGRKANTENMHLESLGVVLKPNGAIAVNDFLQTSLPNIYAAGDVTANNMFVYTAAYEGKLAVDNAFGTVKKEADYKVLPWVIFTDPQVAGVGLDEVQALEHRIDADVAMLPLSYVPRAIAAKDTRGFIKLIRNKADDTLIGARILAPEGSELLMEVAMAIKFGITVSELKEMLHPYLTLAEGIKLAAITFDKDVKQLSCCAT